MIGIGNQATSRTRSPQLGILTVSALLLMAVACGTESQNQDASGLPPTPDLTAAVPTSPTAEVVPTPLGIPEPYRADISACTDGVAVQNPEENPDSVRDCAILLGARDTLLGETSNEYGLDWSPQRPMGQ